MHEGLTLTVDTICACVDRRSGLKASLSEVFSHSRIRSRPVGVGSLRDELRALHD